MKTEAKTNTCPFCWGQGVVAGNGLELIECKECSGSAILSDSELADLYQREK